MGDSSWDFCHRPGCAPAALVGAAGCALATAIGTVGADTAIIYDKNAQIEAMNTDLMAPGVDARVSSSVTKIADDLDNLIRRASPKSSRSFSAE